MNENEKHLHIRFKVSNFTESITHGLTWQLMHFVCHKTVLLPLFQQLLHSLCHQPDALRNLETGANSRPSHNALNETVTIITQEAAEVITHK